MKNIVLFDDDPNHLFLLKEAFMSLGERVQLKWFQDFDALCSFIEESNRLPDMIFLDVDLPEDTGFACLKQLKAQGDYAQVPVIIYTQSDYQQRIDECFALGATVFLRKSDSLQRLQKNLEKIMAWNMVTALTLPAEDRTLLN